MVRRNNFAATHINQDYQEKLLACRLPIERLQHKLLSGRPLTR